MSLALNEPKWGALHAESNTTSEDAPQVERDRRFCMQIRPKRNRTNQLPKKSPIELKENSIAPMLLDLVTQGQDIDLVKENGIPPS